MGIDGWISLGVVGLCLVLLIFTRIGTDLVMVGGLLLLMISGVLTTSEALAGLANEGMVTVGFLFVVVAGLRETGGIAWIARSILGRPRSMFEAQLRLLLPVTGMSAFLNNTPVVAMLIPAVNEWARNNRLSVSRLMIPLSYAAIFGGTCTMIGTSTNLVVNGLMNRADLPMFRLFDIAWVGVPCAVVGVIYVLAFSRWLLPERKPAISMTDDPREYTVEMLVEPNSPLVGKTIEQAGLRHLAGIFLIEIDRDGIVIPAVSPQERLRANDRLVFAGVVESVVDLQKIRGLIPATDQVFKLDVPRTQRTLIEVVVSNSCPLVGKTIREGRFRNTYNAVVIAVARNGERIKKKIGDIVPLPGDTLLLEAHPSFLDLQRNSRDFYLVSQLENSNPPRHERAFWALGILAGMVLLAACSILSMLHAAMLASALMILARCCSSEVARRSVDWQVLIVIAAALGCGAALEKSGAAAAVASRLIALSGGDPWMLLFMVYFATTLFTEVITNNAAAALVFPIALATTRAMELNFTPFAVAIMMGASASFATPIGYQTNLMVYGPGGYRFTDYVRIGLPLNLTMMVVTCCLAPLVWPLR